MMSIETPVRPPIRALTGFVVMSPGSRAIWAAIARTLVPTPGACRPRQPCSAATLVAALMKPLVMVLPGAGAPGGRSRNVPGESSNSCQPVGTW